MMVNAFVCQSQHTTIKSDTALFGRYYICTCWSSKGKILHPQSEKFLSSVPSYMYVSVQARTRMCVCVRERVCVCVCVRACVRARARMRHVCANLPVHKTKLSPIANTQQSRNVKNYQDPSHDTHRSLLPNIILMIKTLKYIMYCFSIQYM